MKARVDVHRVGSAGSEYERSKNGKDLDIMAERKFENVTFILPAISETYLFEQTIDILLETCRKEDIKEIIAVVCKRTEEECLRSIEKSEAKCREQGIDFTILWQKRQYVGGAIQDAIEVSRGSHMIIMAPDLETHPIEAHKLIELAKKYPEDISQCSRFLEKGCFVGYNKVKLFCNYIFQWLWNLYYGIHITDKTFGYRIYPADLMKSIRWEEAKHPFYLETCLKPARLGIKFHEIPGKFVARSEGESQNTFWQTFKYIPPAIKWRFYKKDDILKREGEGK